jgi:hypothetical protein
LSKIIKKETNNKFQGCDLRIEEENNSVATPRPGKVIKVKDKVNQLIAESANQKTPRNLDCQACLQYETPDSDCVKRFSKYVYVNHFFTGFYHFITFLMQESFCFL